MMLNVSADEARERFGIELVDRINSGLAVLRPEVFNFDWMEEFLGNANRCGPATCGGSSKPC